MKKHLVTSKKTRGQTGIEPGTKVSHCYAHLSMRVFSGCFRSVATRMKDKGCKRTLKEEVNMPRL